MRYILLRLCRNNLGISSNLSVQGRAGHAKGGYVEEAIGTLKNTTDEDKKKRVELEFRRKVKQNLCQRQRTTRTWNVVHPNRSDLGCLNYSRVRIHPLRHGLLRNSPDRRKAERALSGSYR